MWNPRHIQETARIAFAVCCAICTPACQAPALTAGIAGAQLASRGSFGAAESGIVIQSDMEDLGLAMSQNTVLPKFFLRDGPRHLELSGFEVDMYGEGTVQADITINGQTLSANTDVDSHFAMGSYSGVLTWDVARIGSTLIGVGIGLEWISLDVGLSETGGSIALESEQQFPLPLLGVRIESEDAPVVGHLNLGWIALESPDVSASILDVDGRLEARLIGGPGRLQVMGMLGYRGFDMDVEYGDGDSLVEADFKIGGPYAGLRIRF